MQNGYRIHLLLAVAVILTTKTLQAQKLDIDIANIYLALDNPAKAKEYANLLIQNDYDKSDGKDFLKDAEKLELLLFEHKLPSRRVARL
jgi:hypothetical protein